MSRRAYGQQEKIARSLIPHEHALAGSFYGKFFARNLNLHVLQRDPERWKSLQAAAKQPPASTSNATATNSTGRPHPNPHAAEATNPPGQKTAFVAEPVTPRGTDAEADKGGGGRRKASSAKASRPQDEIDALFDATLGKKVKKAELASADKTGTSDKVESPSKSKSKAKEKEKGGDKKSRKRKKGEEGAVEDRDLSDVLGAIRSAPKEDKGPKRKRAH